MQKGFAHLVLLLLVLLIAVSTLTYFYIIKTPDNPLITSSVVSQKNQPLVKSSPIPKLFLSKEVSDLVPTSKANEDTKKVYQNNSIGFEFNYQGGLVAKEDSEEAFDKRGNGDYRKNFTGYVRYEPGIFLGAVSVLDSSNSFDDAPFSLWVFDNPDNLDANTWYNKYWYYPFVWGDFSSDTKSKVAPTLEASISGQLSESATISYQPGKPKFIYLNSNGKMFLFKLFTDSTKAIAGNQILSSFKLLK